MPKNKDLADLFYLNEEDLAVTEEDHFQNLLDCEVPPSEIKDAAKRARYVTFIEAHKGDHDDEE